MNSTSRRTPAQITGAGFTNFAPLDVETLEHVPASRAINGRRNVDTEAELANPDRTIALVGMDGVTGDGAARLLGAIKNHPAEMPRAEDVLPASEHSPRGRRILRLVGAGAALALGVLCLAPAGQAQAAVVPLAQQPVDVVLAGPTVRLHLPVLTTAANGASVTMWAPTVAGSMPVASGTAHGAVATLNGTVASRLLTPGSGQRWELYDGAGVLGVPTSGVLVSVVRQSRVSLDPIAAIPGGLIVTARATHYDPKINGYAGDQQSTVTFVVRTGGRVVRQVPAPTALDGSVFAVLPLPVGSYGVTAVRTRGANVTGASSASRSARVSLPLLSARGGVGC